MAISVREPSWLGALIAGPGEDVRCSPQEDAAYDVPRIENMRSEIPGGFGPVDVIVPRPEGPDGFFATDRARQWLGAPAQVYDEANRQVHRSRITENSRIGVSEIVLRCEGMAKSLEDDETARLLGIDRELAKWEGMAVQRKLNLLALGVAVGDATSVADNTTGAPSLETAFESPIGQTKRIEGLYDAQGLRIGAIDYAWKKSSTVNSADTNYDWRMIASSDDVAGSAEDTGNLRAAGPGSGTLATTGGNKRYAIAKMSYDAAGGAGAEGLRRSIFWTQLAVIGDHGLPLQGTVGTGINDVRGLLVSDVVRYVVGRWGPLLRLTGRSIEPTAFAVPQVVFMESTQNAADMIEGLVLLGGNSFLPLDWGAYDDDEFFLASPGNYGRVWEMRLDEASEEADAGDDIHERINGIRMEYDDGSGSMRSVGPPGSGSDVETTALQDLSPDNPVNRAKGFARKWRSASMGITSQAGATLAAQTAMFEANRKLWRGEIDAKGTAREWRSTAQEPIYMIRAGDRGVVGDSPDTAERRITETSYDSQTRTCKVTIGQSPQRFETLLARLDVQLAGFVN